MVIMIMKNTVTLHSCVTCEYTGNHEEVTAAHHESAAPRLCEIRQT